VSETKEWFLSMSVTSPDAVHHPKVSRRDAGHGSGALKRALGTMSAGIALCLVFGFLGVVHAAGDSFAAFRGGFAAVGLGTGIGFCLFGAWKRALASVALPAAAILSLVPHWAVPLGSPGPLSIYQKNLHYQTSDVSGIAEDILASGADIVALQEVHWRTAPIIATLSDAYPWRAVCPFHLKVGGVALLSRHPFADGGATCSLQPGMVSARIETPAGPVTAASVHFRWPWPHSQADQARGIAAELADLEGPVVVAGDFNMVRWSATVDSIARAARSEPVGPAAVTLPFLSLPFAGVSIDHVLAPGGHGTVELRPRLGSDHRGLLARVALP
ncbi:MAG: endonuclease/exonuclease/phosphatase family protein, partial [Pseudomonadota bacterium]